MQLLSDHDMDVIIDCIAYAMKHHRIKLCNADKESFKSTVKSYIRKSGLRENVCHHCLGTGYEPTGLKPSEICKTYQIQNCHDCDDLNCGDNMNKRDSAGGISE